MSRTLSVEAQRHMRWRAASTCSLRKTRRSPAPFFGIVWVRLISSSGCASRDRLPKSACGTRSIAHWSNELRKANLTSYPPTSLRSHLSQTLKSSETAFDLENERIFPLQDEP